MGMVQTLRNIAITSWRNVVFRLGNEGGKLVLDEGDLVEEPVEYRWGE